MSELKMVKTVWHNHPVQFDAGPRIERTDTILLPCGETVEVNYWYENGRLVRVA